MKLIVVGAVCALMITPAQAETIDFDRSFERYGGYSTVTLGYLLAQTFTVRNTGKMKLVEVALTEGAGDGSAVDMQLVRTRGGAPSLLAEDLLVSTSAPFPDLRYEPVDTSPFDASGFVWVRFAIPDVRVQQDDRLAIVLSSTVGFSYMWAANFQEDYPDGLGYWGAPDELHHRYSDDQPYWNYLFRTSVTPVPEPPTMVFAILSAAGFVRVKRRLM